MKIALAFPDLYEIGTSHFGLQILYHILNKQHNIAAERVFAPAKDLEAILRQKELKLFSLESQQPLEQFDIIGFSLLYELNYTNVLNMIDLAQIPLRWKQRDDDHPLIIAGGPCVCNPEPMAEFFDAMVFGDGESVILEMTGIWLEWKKSDSKDKTILLRQWAGLAGVYIPRFFKAGYDEKGFQSLEPVEIETRTISRAIVTDLDQCEFPERPIIPFGKPIHDRLRLEVSRGCTRGCRFCQAGMIYRPVRERSPLTILELVSKALNETGYEDLSLLSLSTGDYTCLTALMENLMQRCQKDRVAVSLPSLRADALTPRLMELVRSVRKTGFTIAPEAGSQRLRDVINKNIGFDNVAATVKHAFELGWRVIKLYFMIGLPSETEEDLDAIVDMVQKLKSIKGPRQRRGQINVSITTFIPKPHTPFQWAPQLSLDESKSKIAYLKSRLAIPGVRMKWQNPEMSRIEGILARGDRRLAQVIFQAWKKGCTFDGWSDQFDFDTWRQTLKECAVDSDFYTIRKRHPDEPLPWDHMDSKVAIDFFKEQWRESMQGSMVDDCRHGKCHNCGVCDFTELQPRVFEQCPSVSIVDKEQSETQGDLFEWHELTYRKLGQARFFGHLELNNLFCRAVRRAKIEVKYSKGFHPMPRISFDNPLPLGMESEAERLRLMVSPNFSCQELMDRINLQLVQGIKIIDCRTKADAQKRMSVAGDRFCIRFNQRSIDNDRLQQFWSGDTWMYTRHTRKGSTQNIDLRANIRYLEFVDEHSLFLELHPEIPYTIRPANVLKSILELADEEIQGLRVLKLAPKNMPSKDGRDYSVCSNNMKKLR